MRVKAAVIVSFLGLALAVIIGLAVRPPSGSDVSHGGAEAVQDSEVVVFALAETNDVHGYILSRRESLSVDEDGLIRYPLEIGGVEWLAGYLDVLKQHFEGRLILVDGGDMFQGTMISNRFEGATVVAAMNRLGYHAAVVGNHEFDFGPVGETDEGDPFGALRERAREAAFPFLAANMIDRGTGKLIDWEGFLPYHIATVAGVKVAFVGGPTKDTPAVSKDRIGKGLEFRPLPEVVAKYAAQARSEGAEIVIGLVHAGGLCEEIDRPNDLTTCDQKQELFELANALEPGTVDVLVGGHTHRIIAHYVNGTPVVEAGSKGLLFGLAHIHFSTKTRKVVRVEIQRPVGVCHYHFKKEQDCVFLKALPSSEKVPPTFLGREVRPVSFLNALFTDEQKKVLKEAQEKLGPVAVRDIARLDRSGDLPMGLLLTHILLDYFPEADIGLFNESGIRAVIPQGEITLEDVFQVLPFDSTPAFIRVSGAKLLDLLRVSTSGSHGGPVVRGLKLVVDNKQDECIREDWNGDGRKEEWERNLLVSATLEDGSPIDLAKEYVLVTTSYLAMGGSDFRQVLSSLPVGSVSFPKDKRTIRELMVDWMKKHPVELGAEGDPLTGSPGGALVSTRNPDHSPGTGCTQ